MHGGALDVLGVGEDFFFGLPLGHGGVAAEFSEHVVLGVGLEAVLGCVHAQGELAVLHLEFGGNRDSAALLGERYSLQ